MRVPDVSISGIGVFLPETVSVEQAVAMGRYSLTEIDLHELAGAAVCGDLPAPEMALRAAREALERCGQRPDELTLLLYADSWHQGPDGWQPQYYLQRHLVGGNLLAVEVRHGCNGMFSAMELAAGFLRTGPPQAGDRPQAALLVAADNFGTPLMDRWSMGPGYVAGDGASAVVLTTAPGFARLLAVGSAAVPEAEEMHRGGEPLFPPGPTVGRSLDFTARNAAFRNRAIADGTGTAVLLRVHQRTLQLVERTLAEADIGIGDITRVAYMNYSREIVEQRCMAALNLPMSMSTWDFGRTVGHLGASDQIVSLDYLLRTGALVPGDHLLMLGVGPGVTLSCAVIKILSQPPWCG
ncbi:ketoacyl-ACP synthase III family protein [Frankia sp. Cr1]|uniref:ketoacyl-ACP synthase III family protein n=1 Tax=Frankia sp. Cr1 TaxID=3073931 RepID=UPI002AD53FC5|nr:ketoacyl-ACP synthase III family protein [Frankia sp. Cr1]